ncbi:MAG TPA: CPXCG motif-containing cysteine-rich protein [Verrucomicrobiales bacterium]|nr:CPXCG motif-containing cysteine-rich protein [Verrucomicrobiales bacterium]
MRDDEAIACPFCGEENSILIDASAGSQRFITDCEVCCRPFEVAVQCEDGELISVVTGGE